MRSSVRFSLSVTAAVVFGFSAAAQAKALVAPTQSASLRATQAEVVVIGKVAEIEKDTVEGPAYANAPKDQKITYKVAVLKIEDPLIGARGLTQLRIGFSADALPAGTPPAAGPAAGGIRPVGRIRPGAAPVGLAAGMDGCFMLNLMPGADFYVLAGIGPPLLKKDENYEKELKSVQLIVKAIDDPVSALKAKDLSDRFRAAQAILQRYQTVRGNPGRLSREPIPEEENKLLLALLTELPWQAKNDGPPPTPGEVAPNRSALWYTINWAEQGFRQPKNAPGMDFNKLMDEATTRFLKESADKIKLKRTVAK